MNSGDDPKQQLILPTKILAGAGGLDCIVDNDDNEEFKKIQKQLGLLSPIEGLDLVDAAEPTDAIDPMEEEYDDENLFIDNQERGSQDNDEIGYDIINIQKTKGQFY